MFFVLAIMYEPNYTIRLNHGGYFSNYTYIEGFVNILNDVDPDLMSFIEIMEYDKEIGYSINTVFWYKMPKKYYLNFPENDVGMLDMFKIYIW